MRNIKVGNYGYMIPKKNSKQYTTYDVKIIKDLTHFVKAVDLNSGIVYNFSKKLFWFKIDKN